MTNNDQENTPTNLHIYLKGFSRSEDIESIVESILTDKLKDVKIWAINVQNIKSRACWVHYGKVEITELQTIQIGRSG